MIILGGSHDRRGILNPALDVRMHRLETNLIRKSLSDSPATV